MVGLIRPMVSAPGQAAAKAIRLWRGTALWKRILAALALGAAAGHLLGEGVAGVAWIGELFIRLIRMVVAPLVFVIVAAGVASMSDARRLGSIGWKSAAMYLLTSVLAVVIGLALAWAFTPGAGVDFGAAAAPRGVSPRPMSETFMAIVPLNPIKALAEGETQSIIFFAVVLGAAVVAAGEAGRPLGALLASGSATMLKVVGFVMETAPFGVFALTAVAIGVNGASSLANVGNLALCLLAGALIQTFGVHAAVVRLFAWLPLAPFYRGIVDAAVVGFTTSSSSASLPVAIRVAETKLAIKPTVASTVLPLGATLGMDGSAMYVAMLGAFAAQAFGIDMNLSSYVLLATMTLMITMGAAPIPSGSLLLLPVVLGALGVAPAQAALVVGFILPFDRIFDMIRTIPNVTCDLSVATAVARWEGEIDVAKYRSAQES